MTCYNSIIRIQVEAKPTHFYELARDWGELGITRLLAEPLFNEQPNRGLSSTHMANCERLDDTAWKLTIRKDARWSSGSAITGSDILEQIKRVRAGQGAGLACVLLLKAIKLDSRESIIITTRIPIAHLDRILANPAFGLRQATPHITSGAYFIDRTAADRIILKPVNRSAEIELVHFPYSSCHDPFSEGEVDISGPVATPHRNWQSVSREASSTVTELDMVYALVLPDSLPCSVRKQLQKIDRLRICEGTQGAVIPCVYTTDTWDRRSVYPIGDDDYGSPIATEVGHRSIYYAKFAGNEEVAKAVSETLFEQWGITTSPSCCDYEDLLSGAIQGERGGFSVILRSTLWPHPASMLAPHFLSNSRVSDFCEAFKVAIATDDLSTACQAASEAEQFLIASGNRFITIGRVVGCVRSRLPSIWSPPSGWIDFSRLNSGKV